MFAAIFFGIFTSIMMNATHSYDDCKSRDFKGEACLTQRKLIEACKAVNKDESKCERSE